MDAITKAKTKSRRDPRAQKAAPTPTCTTTSARWRRPASSSASTARSTRTPRCTRWCAGSSAAASRRRTARRSCSPTSSTPRAASTTSRCWSAGSPPTARSTASASAARSTRSTRAGSRPRSARSPPRVVEQRAVPRDRHHRQGARQARQGPRRHPAADLDAGLGHRALRHAVAVHHQRSRHRRAEHGQLPRPGEGAAAARHEPVAGAAARASTTTGKSCATRGFKKLPCAVVLGAPPCVTFASVQKLPETLDELHVAGALVGAPINVVKAKTVDLLVPAEAEIVIEGFIDTEYLEPEAPFGESHGHVNLQEFNAFMDVTAITRRKDAILTSIISQVTPSRIEPDQAHRHGAAVPELPAQHARHQGHQAGVDARAADQHPQGDRARSASATCRRPRCGARCTAPRCCTAPPASTSSRSTTTSTGQRRRAAVGDVVPRQPEPRHARPAAPRPGPRPAQPAQRRRRTPRC